MAITIYNPTTNESITREFTRSQLFECVKDGFTIAIRKVSDSAVAIFEINKRYLPTGKSVDFNYYGFRGCMKFDNVKLALEFLQ